jgi:hypothetical protein
VLGRDVLCEGVQLEVALRSCLDGDLGDDATGVGIDRCCGMGRDVGVDADHDVDNFGKSQHTGHRVLLDPGTWSVPGPAELSRTVMRHERRANAGRSSS